MDIFHIIENGKIIASFDSGSYVALPLVGGPGQRSLICEKDMNIVKTVDSKTGVTTLTITGAFEDKTAIAVEPK